MRGGTILIASASIGGLAYAAFAFARAGKAIDEAFAFGDLPFLPEGIEAATGNRAGSGLAGSRLVAGQDRTHDSEGR
jgi:hypothetical protein